MKLGEHLDRLDVGLEVKDLGADVRVQPDQLEPALLLRTTFHARSARPSARPNPNFEST